MNKKTTNKGALRVLLTVGPTRAYLDRVRFISNYSTGELGFCLAERLVKRGVELFIVAGPTQQPFLKLKSSQVVEVETAEQMCEEVLKACRTFKPDYAVFSAAVLDFKPKTTSKGKVKSSNKVWSVHLVPTPKIIDEVDRLFPKVKKVGFKLEWGIKKGQALEKFAARIIKQKNLEALCLNFLPLITKESHPGWIINKKGNIQKGSTKRELAKLLSDCVIQQDVARTFESF